MKEYCVQQWLADNIPLRSILRLAGPLGATSLAGFSVKIKAVGEYVGNVPTGR